MSQEQLFSAVNRLAEATISFIRKPLPPAVVRKKGSTVVVGV